MNSWKSLALLAALSAVAPLAAADGKPLNGVLSVHSAMPLGTLHADVNGQLGFGFSFGIQQALASRVAVRGSFSWTGYRVDDRNLWARAFASMVDAGYEEDRMVLRSYSAGVDLVLYSEDGGNGAYFLGGGGIQRSRLYVENRYVDGQGNEDVRNLATWPAADTPYVSVGFGYQGRSHAFIEGKFQAWRYRGVEGYRLLDSPLHGQPSLRDAVSMTLSVGVRF